ncbi:MAG: sugar ABC transporter permease [Chloroflexi bacterium]|jgi:multiple sugar transport system permease protein|nr:sugar ABC transporter permease [Chloroflexota bacterium]
MTVTLGNHAASGTGGQAVAPRPRPRRTMTQRLDAITGSLFLWPSILIILGMGIFPFVASIYLSLTRFELAKGGFKLTWVGLLNYRKLITGSERLHFLGKLGDPDVIGWGFILAVAAGGLALLWSRWRANEATIGSSISFLIALSVAVGLAWLVASTVVAGARAGSLVVTIIYVVVGITFQYLIGLGLALLCTMKLPGRRFFRVVFLLPMMITPVGVAYMFRMMADTAKGPLQPLWALAGLSNYSWTNDAWGARTAVMIGDVWQWTPFMFIVLVAALEGQPTDPIEAARVDGANDWDIFRYVTLPSILPVSTSLVLIRMIEAFKIVDLPRVLTNGGPGTATESLTLHAVIIWRALDFGGATAVSFLLVALVTVVATVFVNVARARTTEAV